MVFQDISNSFDLNNLNQKKSVANLMDRFFSFLIDYLVISPFVLFLLYSTFTNGFLFWKSNPAAPENESFVVIFSLVYVLYFCLIQSLFIAGWRATPGQYFLKIRIQFHESDDFIFFRSFFRQISFWVSFLFLGIPFLSVMTNRNRRTFYDRIADTSVLSLKSETEVFSFEKEFRYWQSFTATLSIFVGFLYLAIIWRGYSHIVKRLDSFVVLQDQKYFCEELRSVNYNERLQVAVALNFANQLSDECLNREADFVLWKEKYSDYSLAYYAKSLTTDSKEKETEYLKQACNGQNTENFSSLSLGCKISDAFLKDKLADLYASLNDDNFLNVSLKYELGVMLDKTNEIENNFSKISKFNSNRLIKKYQAMEMLTQNLKPGTDRAPAGQNDEGTENTKDEILKLIGDL